MRLLLTFLCVLLLAWRSAGATVSAPTIVEISPFTPPTSALSLTNVFKNLSNNMVIRLLPGTHTVQVFPGSLGINVGRDAHLRIHLKTNITVEGLGPQSVLFQAQTGNVFSVSLSENITFKNFAITGTRPVGTPPDTELYGVFNLETNKALVWDGITFKNHYNHCIVGFGQKSGDFCVVKNCWFENCQNTNAWPSGSGYPGDGVSIHVLGNYMKILNNTWTNCGLAIEFEGGTGGKGNRHTLIQGNTMLAGLEETIIQYDTGPAEDGNYSDITIQNNTIKYLAGHGVGDTKNGIELSQMERVKILNNHIESAYIGIYWISSQPTISADISHNSFKDIVTHGIQTALIDGFTEFLISYNSFTNVMGEGILLQGATRSEISHNIFDNVADPSIAAGCIRLSNSDSNTVTRNVVARFGPSTFAPIYIESTSDRNRIFDNDIWHWGAGIPFIDLGTDNIIGPNIVGFALNGVLPKTNTFSGTNVVIDLARHPVQVVEVTNTCLLIITNTVSTALHSGKQVTVMLYNNRTTNVGTFITTANRRLLGVDSALLLPAAAGASTPFSITNGQSMRLQFEIYGTNYSVLANHQR